MAEAIEKPRIVLLVGLPGSGKSTWASDKSGVLSSDALRELLVDDAANQNIHVRVFRVLRYLLKQRLELERPVTYVDATNLRRRERSPYVRLARSSGAGIEAVFFDVPLSECLRRNRNRERIVPEEAIRKMAERMAAPSIEEGFSSVNVVRY